MKTTTEKEAPLAACRPLSLTVPSDNFEGRLYDVPHKFTRAMQDEAFDWFDKQLKG